MGGAGQRQRTGVLCHRTCQFRRERLWRNP
jgi:hypothetical protein